MLMVGSGPAEVESMLDGGGLVCPGCAGCLARWGYARSRTIRGVNGLLTRIRPRRARCTGCGRTHVLLACVMLARRADCAEVIGAALVAKASGVGHRRIAAAAGVPEATVRGWLRRFTARARAWRDVFTSLVMALDPEPEPVRVCGSVFADAVSVMGVAAAAAARRFGPRPPWEFVSVASAGALLGPIPVGDIGGGVRW